MSNRRVKHRFQLVIILVLFIKTLEAHGEKCGELEISLETEINNVEVLCFTEHWLNCHKLCAINTNHFTLANAFCRRNSEHGGSCVFVRKS